jgi:hypothetical protein
MNSITLTDNITFDMAVNALALEELTYQIDSSNLSVQSPDIDAVIDVLTENGIEDYFVTRESDEPWDGFRSDAEADADALASAGMGTDEDYGYYGGDDE